MQEFDHEYVISTLVKFEQTMPVHQYEIDGIKIWPYMRISIINKMMSHFYINNGAKVVPQKERSLRDKLAVVFNTFTSSIKLSVQALSRFSFREFFGREVVDILMFCHTSEALEVGDRQINRNLIGIVDELEAAENARYQIWEFNSLTEVKEKDTFPGRNVTYLSAAVNEWCKFRIAFSSLFSHEEYDFVDQFNQFLKTHHFPVKLESYKLRHEIKRIIFMARILRQYFRRHQVNKTINICYAGYFGMSVNLASYLENVQSIDYQHGIITENELFNTHWRNIPEQGYALIPKAFWVWGKSSYDIVNSWVAKQSFHEVKTVGNAWLNYYQKQLKTKHQDIKVSKPAYAGKQLILLSLQMVPQHYLPFVTEAMLKSPSNWIWVLKEHPRAPVSNEQERVLFGEVISRGKAVFEREYDLYETLTLLPIAAHVTAFSTSAIDCEYFGVPTVFFHENGIKGNANLIAVAEHLLAAKDADSLIKGVSTALGLKDITPVFITKNVSLIENLTSDTEQCTTFGAEGKHHVLSK